jgi:hypothetical protein
MNHGQDPSVYDKLAAKTISQVTQAELNTISASTYVDRNNVDFWAGVITVARSLQESRTYAHGLVIPESGAVLGNELADGANETFTPTGTEIWRVEAIDLNGCAAALKDADGNMCLLTGPSVENPKNSFPIFLSASMSLFFNNGSGSPATPKFAYHKVGL